MCYRTMLAMTVAAAIAAGTSPALAESDASDDDDMQSMPTMQGGMGKMSHHGRGMGMMAGMTGGMGHRGGPGMMMMLFTMIDTNGDEALQLEEMQAVQQRFFNRMDDDGNGSVSLEEMQTFAKRMHGG